MLSHASSRDGASESQAGWEEELGEEDLPLEATSDFITFDEQAFLFAPQDAPSTREDAQDSNAAPVSTTGSPPRHPSPLRGPAHSHPPPPSPPQQPQNAALFLPTDSPPASMHWAHTPPPMQGTLLSTIPDAQGFITTYVPVGDVPMHGGPSMHAPAAMTVHGGAGAMHGGGGGMHGAVDSMLGGAGGMQQAMWSHRLAELAKSGAGPEQVLIMAATAAAAMGGSPLLTSQPPSQPLTPLSSADPLAGRLDPFTATQRAPVYLQPGAMQPSTMQQPMQPGSMQPPMQPGSTYPNTISTGPNRGFQDTAAATAAAPTEQQHAGHPMEGSMGHHAGYPHGGMGQQRGRMGSGGGGMATIHAGSPPVWVSQATFATSPQTPDVWQEVHEAEHVMHVPAGQGARGNRPVHGSAGGAAAKQESQQQVEKLQAQVSSLESTNQELQRRVTELISQLEQAATQLEGAGVQALRHAEVQQEARAHATELDLRAKAREQQLQMSERQVDLLSNEVAALRQALAREQTSKEGALDEVVRWKGEHQALAKELDTTARKLQQMGMDEHHLQTEFMQLRRDYGVLSDTLAKTKVDLADARDRLRVTSQDAERHMGAVARAELGSESLSHQVTMLKHKVAELEGRNLGLEDEVRYMRVERQRSAQENGAHALRVAAHTDASRPAGRTSSEGDGMQHPSRRGGGGQWQNEGTGMAAALMRNPPNAAAAMGPGGGGPAGYRPYEGMTPRAAGDVGGYGGPAYSEALAPGAQVRRPLGFTGDAPTSYNPSQPPASTYAAPPPALSGGQPTQTDGLTDRLRKLLDSRTWQAGQPTTYPPPPGQSVTLPSSGHTSAAYGGAGGGGYYGAGRAGSDGAGRTAGDGVRGVESPSGGNGGRSAPDVYRPRDWMEKEDLYRDDTWSALRSRDDPARDDLRSSLIRSRDGALLDSAPGGGGGGYGSPAGGGRGGGGGGAAATAPPQGWSRTNYLLPGPATTAAAAAVAAASQQQQQQRQDTSPGAHLDQHQPGLDVPFGTDRTLKDILGRSQAMEDALVKLCHEKSQLDAEFSKLPVHGGRNTKVRSRKVEVEARLETVQREISNLRLALKKLHGK